MVENKSFFYQIIVLILFCIIFQMNNCSAQNKMKAPTKPEIKNEYEEYGKGRNTILNFYQKWISPVKGGNKCPMYPSCSQYAKIAFKNLPWYKAYIVSCERVLRCGRELNLYRTVQLKNNIYWYDPLL